VLLLERERERRGMRVKDFERKKRGKKRERERETYERIQGMRKKKEVKKNNYLQVEFLGQYILFLFKLKSGERERLK
jgi:hypothetical protein